MSCPECAQLRGENYSANERYTELAAAFDALKAQHEAAQATIQQMTETLHRKVVECAEAQREIERLREYERVHRVASCRPLDEWMRRAEQAEARVRALCLLIEELLGLDKALATPPAPKCPCGIPAGQPGDHDPTCLASR